MHRSDVRGEFPGTESDTVTHDLTVERPRELARYDELTTEYGSPSHVSEQKSRSADQRKNLVDNEFLDADGMPIEDALEELEMPQEYHVHPADTAGGVADPPPGTADGRGSRQFSTLRLFVAR